MSRRFDMFFHLLMYPLPFSERLINQQMGFSSRLAPSSEQLASSAVHSILLFTVCKSWIASEVVIRTTSQGYSTSVLLLFDFSLWKLEPGYGTNGTGMKLSQ